MRSLLTVAIGITLAIGIRGWWRSRRRAIAIQPVTPQWRQDHAYEKDGDPW